MKVAVFSSKPYDVEFLKDANAAAGNPHDFEFFEERLGEFTAAFAVGSDAVCPFVNDDIRAPVLEALAGAGVKSIVLRCAGFNNVDLRAAAKLGIRVARVPAYSPYAVAEFALTLVLALNRKIHRAYNRVRDGNFSINGLLGFDVHGKTVGVLGTGKIGRVFARTMSGFGVTLLGSDPFPHPEFKEIGGTYVPTDELFTRSDIISLHLPLTPETKHIINAHSLARMKTGVMIVNTSRGALVNAEAVTEGLKSGKIGHLGLDVYEQEQDVFYENLSEQIIQDDVLQLLITFPNVLVTSHQAYFTENALRNIAETTLKNLADFSAGGVVTNEVTAEKIQSK